MHGVMHAFSDTRLFIVGTNFVSFYERVLAVRGPSGVHEPDAVDVYPSVQHRHGDLIASTFVPTYCWGIWLFRNTFHWFTLPRPTNQEEGTEKLPLEAALNCILAAFRALQGPGRELQTDEAAFVSALYRRLPDLLRPESGDTGGRNTASCVALVTECLDAALGKRRELSTARVAAIIKQLLSISLQMTQVRECRLRKVMRYACCCGPLWNDKHWS